MVFISKNVGKRINDLENKVILANKDKWRQNILWIVYKGTDNDINNNKKYHIDTKYLKWYKPNINIADTELIYDNLEDFYKEYNLYPNKDINPQIIEIVDNSHLEKYLYMEEV